MKKNNYSSIETIINVAKRGGMYILVDDEKRENEGDLVMSTSDTNARNINFMAKYGRGLICLALTKKQIDNLIAGMTDESDAILQNMKKMEAEAKAMTEIARAEQTQVGEAIEGFNRMLDDGNVITV